MPQNVEHSVRDRLVEAMLYLFSRCDGAQSQDNMGYKGGDLKFMKAMRELAASGRPMTYGQMSAMRKVLNTYHATQLEPAGYLLPSSEEILALFQAQNQQRLDINLIHVDAEFIYLHTLFRDPSNKVRMYDLKNAFFNACRDDGHRYCGAFRRGMDEAKALWLRSHLAHNVEGFWRFPRAEATLALIFEHFPQGMFKISPEMQLWLDEIEARTYQENLRQAAHSATQQRELNALLDGIGGLDAPLPNGKTLFPHQKEDVRFFLSRRNHRAMFFDDRGLGKTISALVSAKTLQAKYGYRIYVVTTVSAMMDWEECAEELHCRVEVFSWDRNGIPHADLNYPPDPFILIVDEAHYAQNKDSQRTRALLGLAWHENCQAVIGLTGTPMKNGQGKNFYPLMLLCKHPEVFPMPENWSPHYPIVWSAKEDDGTGSLLPAAITDRYKKFELKYCGAHEEHFGKKRIWVNTGATNKHALHMLTMFKPEREKNHEHACFIAHKKQDCVDLPPKMRQLCKVELSKDAQKVFWDKVAELKAKFEAGVKAKLELFKEEYKKKSGVSPTKEQVKTEEEKIRTAEALVSYGNFRQAGAIAKCETALEQILEVLEEGGKVVVFTHWMEVVERLIPLIEAQSGKKVGRIDGTIKPKDRQAIKKDFQDPGGEIQTVICTAAASEAITLTAAQFMIIIDRPWTPGQAMQEEDRIHRLGTTGAVTIVWAQLPKNITEIDINVDGVLIRKQQASDRLVFDEETNGIDFATDEEVNAAASQGMLALFKKVRKTGKAA